MQDNVEIKTALASTLLGLNEADLKNCGDGDYSAVPDGEGFISVCTAGIRRRVETIAFKEDTPKLFCAMAECCGSATRASMVIRLLSHCEAVSQRHIACEEGELRLAATVLGKLGKSFILLTASPGHVARFENVYYYGEETAPANEGENRLCLTFASREAAVSQIPDGNMLTVEVKRKK